ELGEIIRLSNDTLQLGNTEMTLHEKKEWWELRKNLNERLNILLDSIQDDWLGGLKGVIQSHNTPVKHEHLLTFQKTLDNIIFKAVEVATSKTMKTSTTTNMSINSSIKPEYCHVEIDIEICRLILNLGNTPTDDDMGDVIHFL